MKNIKAKVATRTEFQGRRQRIPQLRNIVVLAGFFKHSSSMTWQPKNTFVTNIQIMNVWTICPSN